MSVRKAVYRIFRSEDGLYHLKYPYPPGRNSQPSLFLWNIQKEFYHFIKKSSLAGCKAKYYPFQTGAVGRRGKIILYCYAKY